MEDRPERRRRERQRVRRRRRAVVALLVLMLVAVALAAAMRGGGGSSAAGTPSGGTRSGGGVGATTTPAAPVAGAAPVSVTVVGDTVMGSLPYGLPPDGGASLFGQVRQYLTGDVVLGNLEGTLSSGGGSKCGAGSPNCYAFQTPPSYARWLKRAGFTVMNLANNHAYDYGPSGQRQTVAALTRYGIRDTGRPGTMAVQTIGGQRVAILGFAPYTWADSLLDIPRAKRRVRQAAAQAQIVVVMIHAGAEGGDRTHVPAGDERAFGEDRGDSRAFTQDRKSVV